MNARVAQRVVDEDTWTDGAALIVRCSGGGEAVTSDSVGEMRESEEGF